MEENHFSNRNIQDNNDSLDNKKVKKRKNMWLEISVYILLLFFCGFVVPQFILQRTIIKGSSMESNLYHGENVLVEKVSKHFKDFERFDIIVFYPYGKGTEEYYIKRVIGLPGEEIQIKDSTIYINGEVLEEDYGKDPMETGGIAEEPIILGEDEYFVLGDNRLISQDSRSEAVGPVSKDKIAGKVLVRIWPFSKFGSVD